MTGYLPRPDLAKISDLNIDFMHHAGNASGVVDGSAAILLASCLLCRGAWAETASRVVAMANMEFADDAECSSAGARRCWRRPVSHSDIDLFEVNGLCGSGREIIRDLARP